MYESFEITVIEINKHKVGGTVAFNWAFTWFFNSSKFGDTESRTRNWNHGCVLSILKWADCICCINKPIVVGLSL